jgi:cytochrome c556
MEQIKADVASLREHVAKFRRLAEQRHAADDAAIARKLLEVAADFEAKAAALERLIGSPRE